MIKLVDYCTEKALPKGMRTPQRIALAYAYDMQKKKFLKHVDCVYIWADLEKVKDNKLDFLAVENRVLCYNAGFTPIIKRSLIQNYIYWYIKFGTKQAVEELLSVLYGSGKVTEWFEYDGKPGYFRIYIKNLEDINPGKDKELKKNLYKIKRHSAHLDVIIYGFEYWIKWIIDYKNCLTMISDFYPRYNLPYLMYDGTAPYNKYKYNGYKTDSFVDLYPTKLSVHIPRLFVYDHIPKMGLHDETKQQVKSKTTFFYLSESNSKVGIENRLDIKTAHKGSVPTYQVSLTIGKHLTQYNGKYQYNGTRKYDSKIIHEIL